MKIKKIIFLGSFLFLIFFVLCNKNSINPIDFNFSVEGKIELISVNGYYKDDIFYDSTGDTINLIVKIDNVSKVNRAELFIKDPKGVIAQYVCWAKEREADSIIWKTRQVFNCSGGRFAELVMSLEDGTVKRSLQTIAIKSKPLKLIQLTVDSVEIEPAFSDSVYKYTAEVNCDVEEIGITASFMGDGCNVVLVNSSYRVDTLLSGVKKNVKLKYGLNVLEIISKPKNDTNKNSYIIQVFRRGGKLDSLWITSDRVLMEDEEDSIMLIPSFHRDSMKYELKLPYDDSVITITVQEMYDSDLIFIDNENLKEKTVTFPGGVSKVVIKVVSHDRKDSVEYKIFVERKQSDEARLKGIVFSPVGMLVPEFNSDIKEYIFIIPDSVYELTVVPLPVHRKSEVEINNSKNFVSTMYLNSQRDTVVVIKITSESKNKEEEYKVSIKRSSSDIALIERVELSEGELIPKFNRDTFNYEIRVSNSTDSIKIKPFIANVNSEVKIDSSIILPDSFSKAIAVDYGKTTEITLMVVSESGRYSRKYNFIVNRPYLLKISSNNREAGTIEPEGSFEAFSDSIIFLKAIPKNGYRFVMWMIEEGEDVKIEDSTSTFTLLKVDTNASIVGEFEAIQEEETGETTN